MSVSELEMHAERLPTASPRRWRLNRVLAGVLAEPLTHFLIAGLALFLTNRFYHNETSIYRIVLTSRHIAQLANNYALQFGASPDPQTLEAVIRRDLDEEILFREGLALGLDQNDEIVRRRIVQKMQFLIQDLNPPPEPTQAQLQAYYDARPNRYVTPPQATFSHIYFSADQRGDEAARAQAQAVVSTLSNSTARAPDRGDPFPDLYDFSAYDADQVSRLFGRTPFAEAVFSVTLGRWAGPFRSGYGWHLLYVDARHSATRPPLSDTRDIVRTDYLQDAQDKANQAAFDELAKRFKVVRQDHNTSP